MEKNIKKRMYRDFPGRPVIENPHSHCRGHELDPVRELRSCMPCGVAKKKKKYIYVYN